MNQLSEKGAALRRLRLPETWGPSAMESEAMMAAASLAACISLNEAGRLQYPIEIYLEETTVALVSTAGQVVTRHTVIMGLQQLDRLGMVRYQFPSVQLLDEFMGLVDSYLSPYMELADTRPPP